MQTNSYNNIAKGNVQVGTLFFQPMENIHGFVKDGKFLCECPLMG